MIVLMRCSRCAVYTLAMMAFSLLPAAEGQAAGALVKLRGLISEGHYAEAEAGARKLLAEVEARGGGKSLEAAEVIDLLVESLWRSGAMKDPAARAMAERAVAIKEQVLGVPHPGVALSLHNQAALLESLTDYAAARPLYERALAMRETTLGPEHLDVATTLAHLGLVCLEMGDYAGAKPLYQRALAITQKRLGPDHTNTAWMIYNLANLLRDTGEFDEARPLYERALEIKLKVLGPDHPDVAWVLDAWAVLYDLTGDFAQARRLYERALLIRERAHGPESLETASSSNNLALLLQKMGEYGEARKLHERALEIRERHLGLEDLLVAQSLHNVAGLLADIGDYQEARSLYQRALGIREKTLGPNHWQVADSLRYLAGVYHWTGENAEAERLYRRALEIWEGVLGPDHVEVTWTVNSLARLRQEAGDRVEAELLYRRCLTIREKVLGPEHPDVAESLQGLAALLLEKGDLEAARPLFERALAIRQKALEPDHPLIAATLNGLAELLAAKGDARAALEASIRAEEIGRAHLRLTARTLAEREALRYAWTRPAGLDTAISLLAGRVAALPDSAGRVWDQAIRSRSLVLDEMARRHRDAVETRDAELARLASELTSARTRLANLTVHGSGQNQPARFRELLDGVRRRKEEAERALAARSASFRRDLARDQAGLAEISSHLPSGSALVAIVLYDRHGNGPKGVPSYAAFVIRAGQRGPTFIPLGAALEIDDAVSAWAREAARGAALEGFTAEQLEAAYRGAGDSLRRKIWDPVAPYLGGARRVFVVPDGAINLVNLASLPAGTAGYLIEQGPLIHYLSAERDLVAYGAASGTVEGDLLVVGGPAFDDVSTFAALDSGAGTGAGIKSQRAAATSTFRGAPSACEGFRSARFEPLPGAAREAKEIQELWQSAVSFGNRSVRRQEDKPEEAAGHVISLTAEGATEAAFKQHAPGKSVLHLATHGFFLGGRCPSLPRTARGIGGIASSKDSQMPPAAMENPLLLSGLALAGANHRSSAGADEEDGILTAEEIAAMDLTATRWAVLSACDTGVGEVAAGEGTFGLRRAFQLAGVGTVIMSLWSVEDQSALEWMRALYHARLHRNLGTSEAVREASLELLRGRRRNGLTTHPFYWASFVAAGDWR